MEISAPIFDELLIKAQSQKTIQNEVGLSVRVSRRTVMVDN
jgi:hypothetical protein